jgi:hypothetical protein
VLEAEASGTVSLWKLGRFEKEYFLEVMLFKVEYASFCSKYAYLAELKKHMYLSNENHLC